MSKNNQAAFPLYYNGHINYGMTLRDWFAGMALQGLLANYGKRDSYRMGEYDWCEEAYAQADKMMTEREK